MQRSSLGTYGQNTNIAPKNETKFNSVRGKSWIGTHALAYSAIVLIAFHLFITIGVLLHTQEYSIYGTASKFAVRGKGGDTGGGRVTCYHTNSTALKQG